MAGVADIRSPEVLVQHRADGSSLLQASHPLPPYPVRLTERLQHWAEVAPDRVFLAERAGQDWRRVSYAQAWKAVRSIGQALVGWAGPCPRTVRC